MNTEDTRGGLRDGSERLIKILGDLYDAPAAGTALLGLERILDDARSRARSSRSGAFSERDAILISYPDMVREPGVAPLSALCGFCETHLAGLATCVHLLPFFPSSSDDGFSVVDYRAVDPAFGGWEDVERLHRSFRLMIDGVFNHVSARSEWFRGFIRGDPRFSRFFIVVPEGTDLSAVARPRESPLLTPVETAGGTAHVWTTFGPDQVDLNYSEPAVLKDIVRTLLYYVERGADLVRLDAIAYAWKEIGTRCIHLPRVHRLVQLFRAVLDEAAPGVALVTETNVPHEENISYFGNGSNEAQMVYNFALPPLVLHAFLSQRASALSRWAETLDVPSPRTTFLNFLASHDGIGVTPVEGILGEAEIASLVGATLSRGGRISYREGPGGTRNVYELNIALWDALCDPETPESMGTRVDRFIAAHAILLALRGVPALYFHSIVGSVGWREGPEVTGSNRSVNRQKLDRRSLETELRNPGARRALVFDGMARLLTARSRCRFFHPREGQRVLHVDEGVFAVVRGPAQGGGVLCIHNVSAAGISIRIDLRQAFGVVPAEIREIVTRTSLPASNPHTVELAPHQFVWLQAGERASSGSA